MKSLSVMSRRRNHDRLARRHELDGIADEADQYAHNRVAVCLDLKPLLNLRHQLEASLLGEALHAESVKELAAQLP